MNQISKNQSIAVTASDPNVTTDKKDPYHLTLPHPQTILDLADDEKVLIDDEFRQTLEMAAQVQATDSDEAVRRVCDEMLQRLRQHQTQDNSYGPIGGNAQWTSYDNYFLIRRLPQFAPKQEALHALAAAWALTLRDSLDAKRNTTQISPFECEVLRQAFATVMGLLLDEVSKEGRT